MVAALALAFTAVNAYADPTPTQLPGAGLIRAVNTGTTISSPSVFGGPGGATFCITSFCGQTGGVAGDQIFNGSLAPAIFPGSIQLNNAGTIARAVIRWGGNGGSLESYNPAGFNIGANATMYFTSSSTVTSAAVLNIDASGNPSQIFGRLISTANVKLGGSPTTISDGVNTSGGAAPAIFVANASGVIVGSTGEIHGPNGIALIGANLNGGGSLSTAEWDFVANNGAATSFLDVTGGQSTVDVRGQLYGGTVGINTNTPAAYILLVGGNVMNTGNMFGSNVNVLAGMRAYGSASISDTVNGVSKVPVQRLFNVDTGAMTVGRNECTSGASCLEISMSGATFANDGSISSTKVGGPGLITIGAAKGIRTGTLGDKNPLVGLYADSGIYTDVYEAGGNTEIYNVVRGYSLNTTLPFLRVNQDTGWNGDVTLNALTVGANPSSIVTTGPVSIRGVNVHIDSTINHTVFSPNVASDLNLVATNSLKTTAAVGAGNNVYISNSGAGDLDIGGDVFSDTDGDGVGEIGISSTAAGALLKTASGKSIVAFGNQPNGDINISGNGPMDLMSDIVSQHGDLFITNNQQGATTHIGNGNQVVGSNTLGPTNGSTFINVWGPLDINTLQLGSAVDVNVTQNSLAAGTTTTIAGGVVAWNDVNLINLGGTSTKLYVDATVNTVPNYDGQNNVFIASGGDLRVATINNALGPLNSTQLLANGLNVALTGPQTTSLEYLLNAPNALTKIYTSAVVSAFDVDLTVLNLRGVQDGGAAYTTVGQKPAAQFVTNDFSVTATGSVNSPITGNTNWLNNQMQIKAMNTGAPVFVDFSAVGGGFQSINLGVTGDVILTSGATGTPFSIVGFATPLIFVPPLVANGGSQLIVNASGNMDVNGVAGPGFPLSPVSFQFPGGVALKAGGYLSLNTPLYNAWTLTPAAFQGVFFEAPTIIAGGFVATNPGSWVNYSTYPVTGPSNTYSITQPLPTAFQFVSTPSAIHNNTYSRVVLGLPFCTTPNPPSPWAPGC
ncbi:MAG: hypothetical protein U1F15_01750 [Burkholderiales bacterium]